MASVTFGEKTDFLILWLVMRELSEEGLGEVPWECQLDAYAADDSTR